jgi:predicted permease
MNDLKFAFRQLLKNPAFTAVAVLTLALGIGANTVVFSVANAVLFRPLGFDNPDRLVWINLVNTQTGAVEDPISWQELEDIRASTESFESIGTFGVSSPLWELNGRFQQISSLHVTPNLGGILRIRPVRGRMFVSTDAVEGAEPVVLISHELWQSGLNGARDVLGKVLQIEGRGHSIVGVLPPNLHFPLERSPSLGTGNALLAGIKDFWLPMAEPRGQDRTSRGARMFLCVGRLKSGVTEEAARVELAALGQRIAADYPDTNRHWSFSLVSLRDQILGRTRQGIPLLAVAVAAVLLICCVNLANLLLARGLRREGELAIRLALGADRRRLVKALMVESTVLALLGGVLGIALASAALHVIRALGSTHVPFIREATLDGTAVAFTTFLSLLTAFVFGLLPAVRQSRIDPAESLHTGSRSTGGPQIRAWQQGLLVGQTALVLVLLTSAGLLLESFRRLMAQDLGYESESVIALDLSMHSFETNADVCRMYRTLRERLAALPGVEAIGTISSAPLTGKWTFDEKPQVAGQAIPESERPSLAATFVAFDYFQAMGIPLREGRYFRDAELKDDGYGQKVILNEAAAALLFPGRSAVGGRFTVGSNPDRMLEVVGVVKDTRDVRLEEKPRPRFYWQYAFGGAQVVIKSTVPISTLMPLVSKTAKETDLRLTVTTVQSMDNIVAATVAERRFLMTLLATYAALALAIAALGIFGVIGYQVAQRTNEFGVRLALGASQTGVLRLVILQALRIVSVGLLIGLILSLATSRLLASQLFELSPHDPLLLGGVSTLLLLVALLASFVPAHRAARVNPMEALRYE